MFPPEFQAWWQMAMENLAVVINDQSSLLTQIEGSLRDSGIALAAAMQRMPAPAPLKITLPGGLPATQQFRRYDGGDDVTLNTEWSVRVLSGTITATIGAGTGILTVTALTGTAVLEILSIRDDVPITVIHVVSPA